MPARNAHSLVLVLVLALSCVVGGSTGAWAEERGTRVAIVEMTRILAESSAIRSLKTQDETQRRVLDEDMQRALERLRGIRDELTQQQAVLAPAALEERQNAFNAEVAVVDQKAKARSDMLQRALEQGETRFRDAFNVVVAEVAKRQGIDIVLPVNASLFAVAEFDLTDRVVERLNEAFPEIVLTFDES